MAEDQAVRIVEWPEARALLDHAFSPDQPCPVTLTFEEAAANVVVRTQEPLSVDMRMALAVRDEVPLCIRICEPICAQSEYTVGIDIFDRPVAAITVRGMTRLFRCDDRKV